MLGLSDCPTPGTDHAVPGACAQNIIREPPEQKSHQGSFDMIHSGAWHPVLLCPDTTPWQPSGLLSGNGHVNCLAGTDPRRMKEDTSYSSPFPFNPSPSLPTARRPRLTFTELARWLWLHSPVLLLFHKPDLWLWGFCPRTMV